MNQKKGATLIEVLIATLILVVVLCSLVYALSQNTSLGHTVRNQDLALNAAQEKLEEIANSDLSQIIDHYHLHTFEVAGLIPPEEQSLPGGVEVVQIEATKLYDVAVRVSWQQRPGEVLTRTLTTTMVRK